MKANIKLLYILLPVLAVSCAREISLQPEEFIGFVEEENDFVQLQEAGEFLYEAKYIPREYQALINVQKGSGDVAGDFDRELTALGRLEYFNLRIRQDKSEVPPLEYNLSGPDEFNSRIEYFSFGMQEKLKVVSGEDTLACVLFHYERMYRVSPYDTFVLAFEARDGDAENSDMVLIYDDELFNKGRIKFQFNSGAVKNLPALSI